MLKDPKPKDLVCNLNSSEVGEIIKVNSFWGWFLVKYPRTTKEYKIVPDGNRQLRRLTPEERADYYLQREKLGITDSWRE